jgi:hypothetical protein
MILLKIDWAEIGEALSKAFGPFIFLLIAFLVYSFLNDRPKKRK